jgi:histidinol-phosphate aminotransferase
MGNTIVRREWLKQSSLAALGLGFSLRSIAGEDYLPRGAGNEQGLINLGANENPYGISSKTREAIIDMIGQANRYMSNVASLRSFKKELASHYHVAPEQVLVTAGSGQALALLARHFNKGHIIAPDITFGILPNTARKAGIEVVEVPLTYDKVHDLPAMLKAINAQTQLVYICNPANPTSTIVKPGVLKSFCEAAAKKTTVLIDEAYIDYLEGADHESMIGLIDQYPAVLVTRTFSKIHGMAGLRVGFVIGHASLIAQLEANYFQSTQFNVSNLSQAAAAIALSDTAHTAISRQKNAAARQYTYDALSRMKFRCIPSYTNFLFFKLENYTGDFAAAMLQQNIVVRSNKYADGSWCRVSVGTMDEMKQFMEVMKNTFNV